MIYLEDSTHWEQLINCLSDCFTAHRRKKTIMLILHMLQEIIFWIYIGYTN